MLAKVRRNPARDFHELRGYRRIAVSAVNRHSAIARFARGDVDRDLT